MAEGAERSTAPGTLTERVFGTRDFRLLWIAQVVSALGDWLGFLAIVVLASRVGGDSPGASIGLVMSARIIPGFLFSAGAGVLVDRFDRKRLMVTCSIVQACVVATLPFMGTVALLVAASLVLEVCTLLWSPAKEASVPHLVPADRLTNANSLSLVAAYGTFPLAAGLYSLLTALAGGLAGFALADTLNLDEVGLALYVDAATFATCALIVWKLNIPAPTREEREGASKRAVAGDVVRELRDGWHYVVIDPTVRAVNVGIATGLIGAAMLVPLGPVFVTEVLGGTDSGFGVLVFALGIGVAWGFSAIVTLLAVVAPGSVPAAFRGHGGAPHVYFEAAAVITALVLLGQVLELRARARTSSAIRALLGLAPKQARLVGPDGHERDVPLEHVKRGDRVRVLARSRSAVLDELGAELIRGDVT